MLVKKFPSIELICFNYDDYIDDENDLVFYFSLLSSSFFRLLLLMFVYTLLLAGLIFPEKFRVSVKVSRPVASLSGNVNLFPSYNLLPKIDVFTSF